MDEGRNDDGRPQPAETVAVTGTDDLDPSPRGRRRRGLIAIALLAVVAVVGAAAAIALTGSGDAGDDHRVSSTDLDSPAASRVFAALGATTSAGSYTATYDLTSTPATHPRIVESCKAAPIPGGPASGGRVCTSTGAGIGAPVTITGVATINQDPYRMRSVSDVTGFGSITTIVDATRLWEQGGGNYGMSPRAEGGPISGFADLVEGTLGPGPGALTMLTLASPNGYLNLSKAAVSGVKPAGLGTVDGVPVTYFEVVVRPQQLLDDPALTSEQTKTIREALAVLDEAGYRDTTTKIGVDANGMIREATSVATFDDGSKQTNRTTFSDFGCAGVVSLPGEPPAPAPTGPCPAPTTTTTAPTTQATPASTVHVGATPTTTVGPGPTTTVPAPSGSSTTSTTTSTTPTGPPPGDG